MASKKKPSRKTNFKSPETLLDNHVASLMEHFESVQIFVTRSSKNGTESLHSGNGNWYARMGQVREWVLKEDERAAEEVRRQLEDSDEDLTHGG